MFSGLQQSSVVWLLLISGGYSAVAADAAPLAVQPVPESRSALSASNTEEHQFTLAPAGDVLDEEHTVVAASPDSTGHATTQPEAINDPLPPAFWPGFCMLALAGTLVSVRRLRRQLR